MAFQPVPNTVELAIRATLSGESCINTFHYRRETAWGLADVLILAEAMADVWTEFTDTYMYQEYVFDGINYRGLRSETDIAGVFAVAPVTGNIMDTPVPNNVALSVARRSGMAGRSQRGRVYIAVGAANNMISTNRILPAWGTAVTAALTALIGIGTVDDWTHVIVSRVQDGVRPANALTAEVLNYNIRNNVVDSQRRRLPGRGS